MQEQFLETVKTALDIDGRELFMSDTFRDYSEWDSLGRLSLIAELDAAFDLQIEDSVFEKALTLEDLFNEVKQRVEAQ
jgi:acyl carrier protein